jgi:hypothetical protein
MMHFLLEWDFATAAREFDEGMARNPSTLGQALASWFPWERASTPRRRPSRNA